MTNQQKLSTRAIGLMAAMGASPSNLQPLTKFSDAEALRFSGFGRGTLAEVSALLIDNDLEFCRVGSHPGYMGCKPASGYSAKVDAFIAKHHPTNDGVYRNASHAQSKTMLRLMSSKKFYEDGLAATDLKIKKLQARI